MDVRTSATFAPRSFSIARLMSILLASFATSNTTVLPSSRSTVVFSVTSGRRMTSVSFMIRLPSTALATRREPLPAFPRLLAAAAHEGAVLGHVRAAAFGGVRTHDGFVNQIGLDAAAEHVVVEVDR